MEPTNRFKGTNSASLCRLACRFDNHIPSRFLPPIYFLQILAQSQHLGPTRMHRAGIFKQSKDLGFFSANGISPDTEKGTKSTVGLNLPINFVSFSAVHRNRDGKIK